MNTSRLLLMDPGTFGVICMINIISSKKLKEQEFFVLLRCGAVHDL
jgi:hypothetical protein